MVDFDKWHPRFSATEGMEKIRKMIEGCPQKSGEFSVLGVMRELQKMRLHTLKNDPS